MRLRSRGSSQRLYRQQRHSRGRLPVTPVGARCGCSLWVINMLTSEPMLSCRYNLVVTDTDTNSTIGAFQGFVTYISPGLAQAVYTYTTAQGTLQVSSISCTCCGWSLVTTKSPHSQLTWSPLQLGGLFALSAPDFETGQLPRSLAITGGGSCCDILDDTSLSTKPTLQPA